MTQAPLKSNRISQLPLPERFQPASQACGFLAADSELLARLLGVLVRLVSASDARSQAQKGRKG